MVDENGSVVVEYEYDVWGKLISVSGSLAGTLGQLNPIRYRGYYYDSESGYYYLQSRYYDPELRRFINADVLENLYEPKNTYLYADSVNTFAYCDNSPVNMVDYSGEKEAINSTTYAIYGFLFVVTLAAFETKITIKSDAGKSGIYKKSKKGIIEIELETEKQAENNKIKDTFSDVLFDFYELLDDKVFEALGVLALEKFYNEFKDIHNDEYPKDKTKQREFLFSDKCVIQEIKHHCLGYWYVEGLIPLKKTSYRLLIGTFGNKTKMKKSCRKIDIAEQDVFEKKQSLAFRYCYGIRDCYLLTMADPYWYGEYERYETPRSDWKNKKIPWNAKPLEWK